MPISVCLRRILLPAAALTLLVPAAPPAQPLEEAPPAEAATAPTLADSLAHASSLAARGDHERAAALFQQILDGHPGQLQARIGTARSLMMLRRPEAALNVVDAGLERQPDDADMQRMAAAVLTSQGLHGRAIEALRAAIALEPPGRPLDHANLGGVLTNLGRYDEAQAALEEAVRLDPDEAGHRRRLGILQLNQQHFAAARQQLQQALEGDSTLATTHLLLAQALEGDGDLEAALEHLQAARRLDPSYTDAHYRTAQLARRLGRRSVADSAIAAFQHMQSIGAKDPTALTRLRDLRDAILDSGEQPDHVFALARLLLQNGFADEALNRFEAVLRQRPGDYRALNHVGSIYLKRRRPHAARERFEHAARLAPDFTPAVLNAGNANMILREPARAMGWYEMAVRQQPKIPMTWLGLASAQLALGRNDLALRTLDRGAVASRPQGNMKRAFSQLQEKARR